MYPSAQQVSMLPVRPGQSSAMPLQVSAAQTGFDITAIMNVMLPMMIVVAMMGMMTRMMGSSQAA